MFDREVLIALVSGALVGLVLGMKYFKRKTVSVFPPPRPKYVCDSDENSEDDDYDSEDETPDEHQTKMILVVNQSLNMSKGKTMAQCCHASLGAYLESAREIQQAWNLHGKQVLSFRSPFAGESFLIQFAQEAEKSGWPNYLVQDAGRTQIAPGSITVCAVLTKDHRRMTEKLTKL